jgi:predicted SprT family Zn-dependent metalloprotease
LELFDLPGGVSETSERSPSAGSSTETSVEFEAERAAVREETVTEAAPLDLETMAVSMTRRAQAFAVQFQLGDLAKLVHVAWNRRMRTAAGRAHYRECQIELNPRLVTLPNAAEETERTFLHELAHLVAHHRHRGRRIRAHGPEWRRACADLGIPGESIYHQLPFEGRKIRRKFAYRCPVCASEFERVKKIRHAVACYSCCREHTGGAYHDRFRLVERKL